MMSLKLDGGSRTSARRLIVVIVVVIIVIVAVMAVSWAVVAEVVGRRVGMPAPITVRRRLVFPRRVPRWRRVRVGLPPRVAETLVVGVARAAIVPVVVVRGIDA